MLNKKQFLAEEKECAEMLGMSLEEYRNDVKNTKVPVHYSQEKEKIKYDNSILRSLGLSEKDLKTRKVL